MQRRGARPGIHFYFDEWNSQIGQSDPLPPSENERLRLLFVHGTISATWSRASPRCTIAVRSTPITTPSMRAVTRLPR